MSTATRSPDLRDRLLEEVSYDPDYWSFSNERGRAYTHSLYQYPAMMVPQVLDRLLDALIQADPQLSSACDPFVGSGTTLTECMIRGLDFYGQDLNPLAVLLARTKAGPFFTDAFRESVIETLEDAQGDGSSLLEATFSNWRKWFRHDVAVLLSRLTRAIRGQPTLARRRFLWVALAETIRLTSNDRTSTYKLYARPEEETKQRDVDPIRVFRRIAKRNVQATSEFLEEAKTEGVVCGGRYIGEALITQADSTAALHLGGRRCVDLILTSPPYGDNTSTVPYGQSSYLPLQWIDLVDIGLDLEDDFLASTHALDTRSLGGRRRNAIKSVQCLRKSSRTLDRLLGQLSTAPIDRQSRVAAFFRDLALSLKQMAEKTAPNGHIVLVLGDRHVDGRPVPSRRITEELLGEQSVELVVELARNIRSKRMAVRNSISSTISKESILVFRKGV